MPMLNRILPAHIDNNYRGQKFAFWLLIPLVLLKLLISLVAIFADQGQSQAGFGCP